MSFFGVFDNQPILSFRYEDALHNINANMLIWQVDTATPYVFTNLACKSYCTVGLLYVFFLCLPLIGLALGLQT